MRYLYFLAGFLIVKCKHHNLKYGGYITKPFRMRHIITFIAIFVFAAGMAQSISLKKGGISDGLPVSDTIAETFALFLPKAFEPKQKWPAIFVLDDKGRGKQAVAMLISRAEARGMVVVGPNALHDSLSVSKNILALNRVFKHTANLFSLDLERIYVLAFEESSNLATLVPVFIKGVRGVMTVGGGMGNPDLYGSKNKFHYISVLDRQDYQYPNMLVNERMLNAKRITNELLFSDTPEDRGILMDIGLDMFQVDYMVKQGMTQADTLYVQQRLDKALAQAATMESKGDFVGAYALLGEVVSRYRPVFSMDSVSRKMKTLKKSKVFKAQRRMESNMFLKESLTKEDLIFYLEEDISSYNFDNLGWWDYKIQGMDSLVGSNKKHQRQLGKRLKGYTKALFNENIRLLEEEKPIDEEALVLLHMLKVLVDPKDYDTYLKIIANSAKIEEHETALFYLEELLINGFTDYYRLDSLPDTGLFRIKKEYRELLSKYKSE
jgi:hypothetical protein